MPFACPSPEMIASADTAQAAGSFVAPSVDDSPAPPPGPDPGDTLRLPVFERPLGYGERLAWR